MFRQLLSLCQFLSQWGVASEKDIVGKKPGKHYFMHFAIVSCSSIQENSLDDMEVLFNLTKNGICGCIVKH